MHIEDCYCDHIFFTVHFSPVCASLCYKHIFTRTVENSMGPDQVAS